MRYDTVIIGGGLSALVCGIELARGGKKVALVAKGHSTLHFWSGSFSLLNGEKSSLAEDHPYSKVDDAQFLEDAHTAIEILSVAGISTVGSVDEGHRYITPTGGAKSCFATIEGMLTLEEAKTFKSVTLLGIEGFLDFYPDFIAQTLKDLGVETTLDHFSLPETVIRRANPTEMRSVAVARALDKEENIRALASIISRCTTETVILPAVLGFERSDVWERLETLSGKTIRTVATMPPSVEGIKTERALRRVFTNFGGTILSGHTVECGNIVDNCVQSITTSKCVILTADNFVLATGSFIGGGLTSDRDCIGESIFGVDTLQNTERVSRELFEQQPFMGLGVVTDNDFRTLLSGEVVDNLYACGAVLGGFNPVKEGSGAGVSMITAIEVAKRILNR